MNTMRFCFLAGLLSLALFTSGCDSYGDHPLVGISAEGVERTPALTRIAVLDDVALRPGVTADIQLTIYQNAAKRCRGRALTAIAIPGASHTAATWELLVEELFQRPRALCNVIALDWPGHGGAALPEGLPFGDLALEDYVAVPPVFQFAWFANTLGGFSTETPPVEEIDANGWNNDVPLIVSLQTVGVGPFERPDVPAGIFAPVHGTRLQIVAFADDSTVLVDEAEINYVNLTGDTSRARFTVVTDDGHDAIHTLMISDPAKARAALALP